MAAAGSGDGRYSWEVQGGDGELFGGVDPRVAEAQQEFANFLIQLKTEGTLSATSACILAHWATLGGLKGFAEKLAFAPGKQSGAYSKHWDRVVGTKASKDEYHCVDMPFLRKADGLRVVEPMPVVPPHQTLYREISSSPCV